MNRQRQQLVKRLEQSGAEYITYLSQLSADEVNAKPSPADWSIHQVAAHMRDTEQMAFLVRAERLLKETHPTFANFDQDEYWRSHPYSPDEPLKKIITDFRACDANSFACCVVRRTRRGRITACIRRMARSRWIG